MNPTTNQTISERVAELKLWTRKQVSPFYLHLYGTKGYEAAARIMDDVIEKCIETGREEGANAAVDYLMRMQDEGYIVDRHYETARNITKT